MNEQQPEVDVRALASLARISVTDTEVSELAADLAGIVTFVKKIAEADAGTKPAESEHRNIMRDDTNVHETGRYTDTLLDAAPKRNGDYVEVKQVLAHDKKRGK